jgi:hypothetical protein
MNLFRLKNKRKFVREIPSAFSPTIRDMLKIRANSKIDERIATEHNIRVNNILNTPKEVYLDEIRI